MVSFNLAPNDHLRAFHAYLLTLTLALFGLPKRMKSSLSLLLADVLFERFTRNSPGRLSWTGSASSSSFAFSSPSSLLSSLLSCFLWPPGTCFCLCVQLQMRETKRQRWPLHKCECAYDTNKWMNVARLNNEAPLASRYLSQFRRNCCFCRDCCRRGLIKRFVYHHWRRRHHHSILTRFYPPTVSERERERAKTASEMNPQESGKWPRAASFPDLVVAPY